MRNANIRVSATLVGVVGAITSLLTLIGARAAHAVPINATPGAITCKVGEPGRVGSDFEDFLDPETNQSEIDLGSLDDVACGRNDPSIGDPPPLVPPDVTHFPFPGDRDIVLHGLFELHGMYGFFNDGRYGVYNLHGIYNVQGILHDGNYYNFDRFGDAAPPRTVPEPVTEWLLGSGLLVLLGAARRKHCRILWPGRCKQSEGYHGRTGTSETVCERSQQPKQ
jgi:hypothetical protein